MKITSVDHYIETLPQRFVPSAAVGLDAVFQFVFDVGTWHARVDGQTLLVQPGPHPNPDVTLSAKQAHWVRIVNGDINGMRAVMTRKMKVSGNIALARRLEQVFPIG